MQNHHIVIIGASFAGLSSLLAIRKRLGKSVKITLIDKRETFTYIPALHEALLNTDALKSFQFSLAKYYPEFKHATITNLDTTHHAVSTSDGETISYDYLVIATGSGANYFGKKDFEENTHLVRRAEDIDPLNKKLEKSQDIVVIGGGYTGIEIASMIATRKSKQQTITLIQVDDQLVPGYEKDIGDKAQKRLEQYGVKVVLGKYADKITTKHVILGDGSSLPSDCTILCGGITRHDSLYKDHLAFDSNYKAKQADAIYYAGDVATGLTTTAHNAMIEGRRIGYLISDRIKGEKNTYPPLESRIILAMALGPKDGMITNGKRYIYLPFLTGLAKKIVEKRVMFEFTRRVMLRI